MKLASNAAPVERFGVVETETDFRIKPTPKAFQILTSKLYKDKIAAIVRELSCNAYDSHVEAGKGDEPFDVHLPNALEPELVIRDYGTGLSDTDVRTIFTTFFESTKENTNEQIGALGLGCKSPFSYVDTYTVKSFWNGKCNTYVCFIENALPKIKRVSSVATDQPNGVEIRITVKPEDTYTFQTKAQSIFKWFPLKPNVTGGRYYDHANDDTPLRKGDNWYYCRFNSASKAIMGNVAYPIDKGVMATHLTEFEQKLLENFVYYFGIGELDVQAGREELSYDTHTIRAIKKRVKAVSKHLSTVVETEFSGCKTFIEATQHYLQTSNGLELFNLVPPRFKGQIITGGIAPPCEGTLTVRRHPKLKFEYPRSNSRRRRGAAASGRTIEVCNVIEPWENVTIFIDDLKRGGRSRFAKFSNESTYPCYMFVPDAEAGVTVEDALKAFKGFPNVVLTSSVKVERATAKVRYFSYPRSSVERAAHLNKEHRKETEIDMDDGGIYVVSKLAEIQGPKAMGDISYDSLFVWVKHFYELTDCQTPIHIVPWTLKKRFAEHDDWQSLWDFVLNKLEERMADKDFMKAATAMRDQKDFPHTLFNRRWEISRRLPKTHPLNKFLTAYDEELPKDVRYWFKLMNMLDGDTTNWPEGSKPRRLFNFKRMRLQNLWKALDDLPLLKAVISNAPIEGEAAEDLAEYSLLALDKRKSSR